MGVFLTLFFKIKPGDENTISIALARVTFYTTRHELQLPAVFQQVVDFRSDGRIIGSDVLKINTN
jgi:hypothetical protein